jgi:oligopeptide/dipeptide ABC transporter ATP-binding protein
MYLGQIVEMGLVNEVFDNPQHPYAEALIKSVPIPDPRIREHREILTGEVPTPIDPPNYCRFAKRCKYVQEKCYRSSPPLIETQPNRCVACFFPLNED